MLRGFDATFASAAQHVGHVTSAASHAQHVLGWLHDVACRVDGAALRRVREHLAVVLMLSAAPSPAHQLKTASVMPRLALILSPLALASNRAILRMTTLLQCQRLRPVRIKTVAARAHSLGLRSLALSRRGLMLTALSFATERLVETGLPALQRLAATRQKRMLGHSAFVRVERVSLVAVPSSLEVALLLAAVLVTLCLTRGRVARHRQPISSMADRDAHHLPVNDHVKDDVNDALRYAARQSVRREERLPSWLAGAVNRPEALASTLIQEQRLLSEEAAVRVQAWFRRTAGRRVGAALRVQAWFRRTAGRRVVSETAHEQLESRSCELEPEHSPPRPHRLRRVLRVGAWRSPGVQSPSLSRETCQDEDKWATTANYNVQRSQLSRLLLGAWRSPGVQSPSLSRETCQDEDKWATTANYNVQRSQVSRLVSAAEDPSAASIPTSSARTPDGDHARPVRTRLLSDATSVAARLHTAFQIFGGLRQGEGSARASPTGSMNNDEQKTINQGEASVSPTSTLIPSMDKDMSPSMTMDVSLPSMTTDTTASMLGSD
jgi:hypothetical protein